MRQPTDEEFGRFLARLSPDWDEAGRVYESLRHMVRWYFERHNLPTLAVEELVDETLDRTTRAAERKVPERMEIPDIRAFTYGVARNILREAYRKPSFYPLEDLSLEEIPSPKIEVDRRLEAFREVLSALPESDRELLLRYYEIPRSRAVREELAKSRGLTIDVLRVRIQRLRLRLQREINKRLETKNKA